MKRRGFSAFRFLNYFPGYFKLLLAGLFFSLSFNSSAREEKSEKSWRQSTQETLTSGEEKDKEVTLCALEKGPSEEKRKKKFLSNLLLVGLGETLIGKYDVESQGILPSTSQRLEEKTFIEGRLAFYLKASLWEKYHLISSLDTDRDEERIFYNPDEKYFYPTYGDDSTLIEETPSQGMFYLRVDWDKSYLLYGNYNTGFTGTELSSYNRSLYGVKIKYESLDTTIFDTPRTKFIGYVSRAKQLASHDEMASTGGSLYYLRHKRVVEGSEKIYIQIRDKDNFFPKATYPLRPEEDYEIDYQEGRIILVNPPLITFSLSDETLIQNSILNGDLIYLIADYEYEPDGYLNNPSYGVRVVKELGNYLRAGTTYIKEIDTDKNYELKGADLLIRLNHKNTSYLSLEYSNSEANTISNSLTYNGGITFTELTTPTSNDTASAQAYKTSLTLDLKDFFSLYNLNSLDLSTYYQNIDPGFSSSGTISEEGTRKIGWEVSSEISEKTRLRLSFDNQKVIPNQNPGYAGAININPLAQTSIYSQHSQIGRISVAHQLTEKTKITQEYRHQKLKNATAETLEGTSDEAATRIDYNLNKKTHLYIQEQYTLRGKAKNITTLGLSKTFKIKERSPEEGEESFKEKDYSLLKLDAEQSWGNPGLSTKFSLSKETPSGSTSYFTYSLNQNPEGKIFSTSTFGWRQKLSPSTSFYQEDLFTDNYSSSQFSRIMGIEYSNPENPELTLRGNYEKVLLDDTSGRTYKDAATLSLSYKKPRRLTLFSKIEVRNMKSDITPTRQFITLNKIEYYLNPDLRIFGVFDYSTTKDTEIDSSQAHLQEYTLGFALRPTRDDKLNLLGKYSYIVDDSSPGQTDSEEIAEAINHIYSIEGIYQFNPRISLTGKYALKYRKELEENSSSHIKSLTQLYLARLSFTFFRDFTLHLEDRLLSQDLADTKKQGLLIEITKPLFKNFVVGIGYNLTDFDDKDLAYLAGYQARGFYFRFTTKFFKEEP